MWSIERFSLHASHTGAGFLEMSEECVWPILYNDFISSFYVRRGVPFLTEGLMFLRLFASGKLVQFFCHVSRVLRLIVSSAFLLFALLTLIKFTNAKKLSSSDEEEDVLLTTDATICH